MTIDLWGENVPQKRKRKKQRPQLQKPAYSITGLDDCKIIGHTLQEWSLAGCTTCIDCHVNIFCPGCIKAHPLDENAINIFCPRHEERTVSA